MTETFYDVLGVSPDAPTDEIQAAYRERLKEVHPDVSDDDDASEATQRLIEARDVLVDEDERARYDRLGHEAYVADADADNTAGETTGGDGTADSGRTGRRDATQTDRTATASGGSTGHTGQNRASRERRASQRVRQERAKRERRASQRATTDGARSSGTDGSGDDTASSGGYGPNGSTVAGGSTYSVRTDVATPSSFGPLLPSGQQLTLLVIFFVLYPLLLFSALLPAFPLFVNVVVGACTLMLIGYLQSMPRISLLVFGGWSGIGVTCLLLLGIDLLSLFGLVVLATTVLPFGFSVLVAWALWY